MMTNAGPQLQATATEFTEYAHKILLEARRFWTPFSLGVFSRESIELYKLGYNPKTVVLKSNGTVVTFFDGITVPIVDYYARGRPLVDVCCRPIDVEAKSQYVFNIDFPIFERWQRRHSVQRDIHPRGRPFGCHHARVPIESAVVFVRQWLWAEPTNKFGARNLGQNSMRESIFWLRSTTHLKVTNSVKN